MFCRRSRHCDAWKFSFICLHRLECARLNGNKHYAKIRNPNWKLTEEEKEAKLRAYLEANKDRIAKLAKEYCQNNKDKIKALKQKNY